MKPLNYTLITNVMGRVISVVCYLQADIPVIMHLWQTDTDDTCEVYILSDCIATGTVLHCMFEQEAQSSSRTFRIWAGHNK